MKRKLVTLLLALACTLGLAGLVACDKEESSSNEQTWGTKFTVETAYAQAQDLGYKGTLDEFIESIQAKTASMEQTVPTGSVSLQFP